MRSKYFIDWTKQFMVIFIFFFTLNMVLPEKVGAQTISTSTGTIENKVSDGATSIYKMAKIVIGAVLFVALIGVIYMVASNQPKAKEAVIGWIAAIILYGIAITVIT